MTKNQISYIWKFGLIALIVFVIFQSYYYKKSIESNPYELTAEIIGMENCFKNGRCVVYKYEYKNKIYTHSANSTWSFSNWCEKRNNCEGYKFRLTIDQDNPDKNVADWEKLFADKQFIN